MSGVWSKMKKWWEDHVTPVVQKMAARFVNSIGSNPAWCAAFGALGEWACSIGRKKASCDPPVQDPWKKACADAEKVLYGIAFFLLLACVLMILYFFFPFFTGAYDLLSVMLSAADYMYAGLFQIMALYTWVWGLLRGFLQTLEDSVGGSPALWFFMAAELITLSFLYILSDVLVAAHWFSQTPLNTVFHFLNTPFRWIKEWIFVGIFGDILGKILGFVLLAPFEMVLLLISIPIGGIWWAIEKFMAERKNPPKP